MAATKGSQGDYMAVAVFCLQQARQAVGLVQGLPQDSDAEFDPLDKVENYVLTLQHIYVSCCILNRSWPSAFPKSGKARRTANTLIQRWNDSEGEKLRNAFAHHEEALADPDHRYRGEPAGDGRIVRGVALLSWPRTIAGTLGEGPDHVLLLGKEYRLDGIHEAVLELEQELSAVLVDPETGGWREEA